MWYLLYVVLLIVCTSFLLIHVSLLPVNKAGTKCMVDNTRLNIPCSGSRQACKCQYLAISEVSIHSLSQILVEMPSVI